MKGKNISIVQNIKFYIIIQALLFLGLSIYICAGNSTEYIAPKKEMRIKSVLPVNTDTTNDKMQYVKKEDLTLFFESKFVSTQQWVSLVLLGVGMVISLLGWFLFINIVDVKREKVNLQNALQTQETEFQNKIGLLQKNINEFENLKTEYKSSLEELKQKNIVFERENKETESTLLTHHRFLNLLIERELLDNRFLTTLRSYLLTKKTISPTQNDQLYELILASDVFSSDFELRKKAITELGGSGEEQSRKMLENIANSKQISHLGFNFEQNMEIEYQQLFDQYEKEDVEIKKLALEATTRIGTRLNQTPIIRR